MKERAARYKRRYERGANELPIRHLITLCEYYKVSADKVLGLDRRR